jgi:hypothetical protein
MAGGMLTKQADMLTAKYLNDVNDSAAGGALVSVPVGAPQVASSATLPGDKIVLDDITAKALSDTIIGTLLGGVYMYVQVVSATRPTARGGIVFFKQADLGANYIAYTDAQPTTAIPTYIAGILISAPTAGNWAWIQVAGGASVLFDNFSLSSVTAGYMVSAKISPNQTTGGCPADVGATVSQITVAALIGVAVGLPTSAVISTVMMTRGLFCGRI